MNRHRASSTLSIHDLGDRSIHIDAESGGSASWIKIEVGLDKMVFFGDTAGKLIEAMRTFLAGLDDES